MNKVKAIGTVKVNGTPREFLNTLSSGPGEKPDTYVLRGGSFVYRVGNQWKLESPCRFVQFVTIG